MVLAWRMNDLGGILDAAQAQLASMRALTSEVGVPIVFPALDVLAPVAAAEGAVVLQAGAGGGDVALFLGAAPPSRELLKLAASLSLFPLELTLNASGLEPI